MLTRSPNFYEKRKQVEASDSTDYSTFIKEDGVPSNDFRSVVYKVKLEGTSPDVTIKTLVYDDDYGWSEFSEGEVRLTESMAVVVPIAGLRFFPHITINGGTSVKVSIKVAGYAELLY